MNTLYESFRSLVAGDVATIFLFDMAVRSTILLVVTTIVMAACRRVSAAARHRLWVLSVAGVLLIPLLYLAAPQVEFALPGGEQTARFSEASSFTSQWLFTETLEANKPSNVQPAAPVGLETLETTNVMNAVAETPSWHAGDVLLVIWAVGAAMTGILSLISIASAQWLVRKSALLADGVWQETLLPLRDQLGITRPVELRMCDRQISPMTWGLRRPVILLPRDCATWTDACRRAVLLHELAHIQRHDWLSQMLAQAACVVYWFHPLVWFVGRQVRKESDRAADDVVLTAGMPATTYAEQLLAIAQQISAEWLHPAPAMARRGQLSERIGVLLDPRRNRGGLARRTAALMTAGACCAVVFVAVVSVTLAEEEAAEKQTPVEHKQAEKPVETVRDQIERALQSTTEVDFQDQPLSDVVEYLSELLNIQIIIDEVALNDEGISSDSPVNLTLAGITLEFALRLMLDPLQLEAVVDHDVLKITTKSVAEGILETRVYDLEQMLVSVLPLNVVESLRKAIIECVAPSTWSEAGGLGVMAQGPPKDENEVKVDDLSARILVIRQTTKVHQQVLGLLADLRQILNPPGGETLELTTWEKNEQMIRKAIASLTEVDFQDQPLTDVVEYLSELHNIQIIVDEVVMNDEGISTDSPVNLTLARVSLKNSLRLMLGPLQLQAVPFGEVLLITTTAKAKELQIVRIYDVSGLLFGQDSNLLAATIKSTVVPDSWKGSGGDGAITPLGTTENQGAILLFVRQTENGHEQVAALLEQLRKVKR